MRIRSKAAKKLLYRMGLSLHENWAHSCVVLVVGISTLSVWEICDRGKLRLARSIAFSLELLQKTL